MTKNELRLFCPATIANISCGFDVLGLALTSVGDEMVIRKVTSPGLKITKITGQELPLEVSENVAGVAGLALLKAHNSDAGFEIEIHKKIKAGSGIGSSAASAAGAVWGMNSLLGNPFSNYDLVQFAMEGERLASGVAHADNVAPAIYGGFTLVRSYDPLDIIKMPTPKELVASVIHPQIEIKTSDSRKILKTNISLADGIKQWGNVGGLISGLYTSDYELIGRSMVDHIIEPIRSILIPGYDSVKSAATDSGVLGCGISGSGPSVFALSRGLPIAREAAQKMNEEFKKIGIESDIYVSKVNNQGPIVLE